MRDQKPALSCCEFGPDGCDPQGGELVACDVCGRYACDFHGDYPSAKAHAEGDWRCPDCMPIPSLSPFLDEHYASEAYRG